MKINIKKLHVDAVIPKYAKNGDAALDLTATSYEYKNGRHVYGTGLSLEVPEGYVALLFPRSSICNYDLRLSNAVGVVDSGFRGEIKLIFENDKIEPRDAKIHEKDITMPASSGFFRSQDRNHIVLAKKGQVYHVPKIYQVGERIAQLMIIPYPKIEFNEVTELNQTERGSGGWGSSGSGAV